MTEIPSKLVGALADRYAIERQLGEGGMATVYLAHDRKHDRKVAVKVLRPELAAVLGGERFLQEIKVTANLQHPHILPLFDSGAADSFLYYVMPFIDGESLRGRLDREKQLSVDESVRIATEVADALDYAHRNDVIHRDIKPENVLLHDGRALVADFGIALAVQEAGGNRLTETGLSLGTPHYMSPEQATADRDVDARSDIYAVGAMLYEMLAGDPPHTGSTAQAVIAKVVTEDARALSTLRKTVPAHVESAVHRAIQRLPADRFETAADFVQALRTAGRGGQTMAALAAQPTRGRGKAILWPALAAVLAVAAVFGWLRTPPSGVRAATRLTITLPPDATIAQEVEGSRVAIAPDGRRIVYVGYGPRGRQLYVRDLESLEVRPIPGSEGAYNPFFSPDGEWIAFVTGDRVARVQAAGGSAFSVGEWPTGLPNYGGAWLTTDTLIMFQELGATMIKMPVNGGPAEMVAPADSTYWMWWPDPLPDGRHLLVTLWRGGSSDMLQRVGVLDLQTGNIKVIAEDGDAAKYVGTGHVIFRRGDGAIVGAPFDLDRLEFTHAPLPVLGPAVATRFNGTDMDVSLNGTLVYIPSAAGARTLVVVDRAGNEVELLSDGRAYESPKYSPDGRTLVMAIQAGAERDLWVLDLDVGTLSRLTFGSDNFYPVWTPSGDRVVFSSRRVGESDIFAALVGEGFASEPLLLSQLPIFPSSLTADDRTLFYRQNDRERGFDLWQLTLGEGENPTPLLQTAFNEASPMLSPDGEWLAYISDQTGRFEVYLRKYPEGGRQIQISIDGGTEPLWRRDGRELFYRRGSVLHAVELAFAPEPVVVRREQLFRGSYYRNVRWVEYDVHPDGDRFAMVKTDETDREIVVTLDLSAELETIMSDDRR